MEKFMLMRWSMLRSLLEEKQGNNLLERGGKEGWFNSLIPSGLSLNDSIKQLTIFGLLILGWMEFENLGAQNMIGDQERKIVLIM